MYTPNLETILAARPQDAIGAAQPRRASDIDRVNTRHEKTRVLAHLTVQLAMLLNEQGARNGDA
jgi:hypothetical protein